MSTPNKNNKMLPFSWHSYGLTDTGKARRYNEDSLLERPKAGLWVVADGMGGHSAGDVASQMIVNSLEKIQLGLSLDQYIDNIENTLIKVNKKLLEKANENKKPITIGSTVVAIMAFEKYCVYFWAGDSRLYQLRNGTLRQMTTDHSQVELYVEQGLMTREEAAVHPHNNMITRAVGATDDFFLDMDIQEIQRGDRYLLCTDGLTRHTEDFEFQKMLQRGTAEEICKKLIALTLSRGARDNTTAIIIDIV